MSLIASSIRDSPANGSSARALRERLAQAEAWIFDLDNTLYPASCNLFAQVDTRIGAFIADRLGIEGDEAYRLQKHYFRTYGTSLRGLMLHHEVQPREFLDFVHEIDVTPVQPDPTLDEALARLPGRKGILTNGSVKYAESVMPRLGVGGHFPGSSEIVPAQDFPKPAPSADAAVRG